MTDRTLPADLPVPLARQLVEMTQTGLRLDVSVDGIPFNLKMTPELAYLRQLVNSQKQQFDDSGQYGEQTFGYWWLRSQHSFHIGAGQEYMDTGTVSPDISRSRYADSTGVFPFNPGRVTVPPAYAFTSEDTSVDYGGAVVVTRGGVTQLAVMRTDEASVDFWDLIPVLGFDDTVSVGTGTPQGIATDGSRVFVAVDDSVVAIDEAGQTSTVATLTFGDPVTLGYAKQRLILGHGPELYEVDPNGVNDSLDSDNLISEHSNPNWRWTAVADGPTGIYVAGYAGPVSSVALIQEQDVEGSLVLGPAIQQATMPTGERILSMMFYVNSLFLLGTTAGLRVGSFTPYGQITWGPASIPDVPITGMAASGTVVHAITSDNQVYWLDLGSPSDSVGRFAYARRLRSDDPLVAVVANDKVYLVTENAIGEEDPDASRTGTLTSSWMTFSTTEAKRAHFITVSGSFPGPESTVTVETIEGDTQTFTIPRDRTVAEFGLSLPASSAYRISAEINQDDGEENVLRSWQLKSLPEPRRYHQLIYPLRVEDGELCSNGQRIGYPGFAADRLKMLETRARRNRVVTVRDYLMNEQYRCMIQDIQYQQEMGPEVTRPLGGIVTLILTAVA